MIQIPLSAIASQTLQITLGAQSVSLAVYTLGFPGAQNLYIDVQSGGTYIARTRIARNCVRVLEDSQYYGFVGDFMFVDTSAADPLADGVDPFFAGLGSQFQLQYLEASDLDQ